MELEILCRRRRRDVDNWYRIVIRERGDWSRSYMSTTAATTGDTGIQDGGEIICWGRRGRRSGGELIGRR